MAQTLTLVIHGTYAADAEWWRLRGGDTPTFADQLEAQLQGHALGGSVWRPALDSGFDYKAFSWSGKNRHRARVKAGKELGRNLDRLADRLAATPDQPLTVNFVAHSHGGNVVLEALRHLGPNVRTGRVALLGTPLISAHPAFRVGRLILSAAWVCLFLVGLIAILGELASRASSGTALSPEAGPFLIPIVLGIWVGYALIFYVAGNLLDVAWRVVWRAAQPLRWLQDKSWSRVYGPSEATLKARLHGSPILLLGTRNDEAEVILRLTSNPGSLYREHVRQEWPWWAQLLEPILLRPFVLGVVLVGFEVLLEVATLGFSAWRAMLFDFEVVRPAELRTPTPLFVDELLKVVPRTREPRPDLAPSPETAAETEAPQLLFPSLMEVVQRIKGQVRLSHTAYYDTEGLVDRVARFLTSGALAEKTAASEPPAAWDTPGFWEAVLVANAAMVALIAWICSYAPLAFGFAGASAVLGYLIPLAGSWAARQTPRLLGRPESPMTARAFWKWWVPVAIVIGMVSFEFRDIALR